MLSDTDDISLSINLRQGACMKKPKVISEVYVNHKKSDKKNSRRLVYARAVLKFVLIHLLISLPSGVSPPLVEINSPLVLIVHNNLY